MYEFYGNLSQVSVILVSLSVILFAGFLVTRVTKFFNLPNVSGFIIAGILIGPYAGRLIPKEVIDGMDFVSDIALAFIAFGVGRFFRVSALKKTGKKVVIITLLESLTAGVLVSLMLRYVFHVSWTFALVTGAIATATAPASTLMTIRQYHARGEFVDILLQVVAMDDVVALLAFSVASSVAQAGQGGAMSWPDVYVPVLCNLAGILLGLAGGFFLKRLLEPGRSKDNRLILPVAMLLGLSGLCSAMDISPLLSCMAFGGAFINLTSDKKLFHQIDRFTPPILSCFFILSGMRLDVGALRTAGVIGVAYFLVRIVGKYLGAYLGCAFCKTDWKVKRYLGVALIPQAGVSIGLAVLGQRLLPEAMGNLLSTIILSSSVLYELVGPASARAALFLSGAIPGGKAAEASKAHEKAAEASKAHEKDAEASKAHEKDAEASRAHGKAAEAPQAAGEEAKAKPEHTGKKHKKKAESKNRKKEKKKSRRQEEKMPKEAVIAWKVPEKDLWSDHLSVVPRMIRRQTPSENRGKPEKIWLK